jgi:hypothetical protein
LAREKAPFNRKDDIKIHSLNYLIEAKLMAFTWFRMYHEFAIDPKVQSMSEVMQRRLVMLFCVRCRDGDVTFQEDELAMALGIPFNQDFFDTKELFIKKGFIDEHWTVLNWSKRQYQSDSSAERTRNWRDRKKDVTSQETSQKRHGDGILSVSVETNTIKDIDTEGETSQKRHGDVTRKRFVKPTVDEVKAYCQESGYSINAQAWMDHYQSNGWKVGKNSMSDWKAAVRTWVYRTNGSINGASSSTHEKNKVYVPKINAEAAAIRKQWDEQGNNNA